MNDIFYIQALMTVISFMLSKNVRKYQKKFLSFYKIIFFEYMLIYLMNTVSISLHQ